MIVFAGGKMMMAIEASLAERLAVLEEAIARLQQQVRLEHQSNWVEQITGSFKDEPAFEQVLAYGHAIRQGDESLLTTPPNNPQQST
jgi:hypothetical protein